MSVVRLVGGPFNGETRDLDRSRRLLTLEILEETVETDWGLDGATLHVTKSWLASYRRVDETTFEYCRTPVVLGDPSPLDLAEKPISFEEDP